MYDRPSSTELIQAAIDHFQTKIVPLTKAENHQLYFQTIVAVNVLKIALRDIEKRPEHLRAEWERLAQFSDEALSPIENNEALEQALSQANQALAKRIREGEFDDDEALFQHLVQTTVEQLEVARPKFLATLASEDEAQ
ncbi:MAG: DUF6285 domain-containing protein [Chloroflexota bacterium]